MRRSALRVLRWAGATLGLLVVYLQCFWAPIYRYAPATPFTGPSWFNPYAGFTGDGLRVNFHAHSRAWGGLTKGSVAPDDIYARYRELGYDLAAISNYQHITEPPSVASLYVPTFEHGLGLGKQHQTVIGARSVLWFDYPLLQTTRHKQHVLDLLAGSCDVLVLNHPFHHSVVFGGGYALDEMRQLSGYQALEVATPYGVDTRYWDAALSAGRPVWGIASDDSGGTHRPKRIARGWLVVHGASERSGPAIVAAVRAGTFHSVWADHEKAPNRLLECRLIEEGPLLHVRCESPADRIVLRGQDGVIQAEQPSSTEARFCLADVGPYARVEIETRKATLYLNPVMRCGEPGAAGPGAIIDPVLTSAMRVGGASLLVGAALLFLRRRRSRQRQEARPDWHPSHAVP